MIQGLKRDGVSVEYSDVRRNVGDRFVVEQHVVRPHPPRRRVGVSTDACVVVHFDDDGPDHPACDEYVDTAAFAGAVRLTQASSGPKPEGTMTSSTTTTSTEHLDRLVPRIVLDWVTDEPQRQWRVVEGTMVFADISGFTALSEKSRHPR